MNAPAPLAAKLWNKDFALWWLGCAQSALGSALAGIALSFLVLKQTGSAGAMGVNLALSMLPALLSPLAGTLVDRLPLRLPLILGNVLRAALQIGVGVAALRASVPVEVLHLLALLTGLIGVLYGPASMSVLPNLVPKGEIARASGLMGTTGELASLVGLVGGGALVSRFGSAPSLIFDGATFLAMAALLGFVRLPVRAASSGGASFWADFLGGARYVRSSLLLTLLPVIALFINAALAPMEMLLPKRMLELGAGAGGFGLFFGLLTGGAALGSLGMAGLGPRVKPGPASAFGLLGEGGALLLMSLTSQTWQLWTLALVSGLALAVTNVSLGVLFQTVVLPQYRGRVGSLLGMVGTVGMPLTLLLLAPFADRVSVNAVFGVSGLITVGGGLAWWLAQRANAAAPAAEVSPQA